MAARTLGVCREHVMRYFVEVLQAQCDTLLLSEKVEDAALLGATTVVVPLDKEDVIQRTFSVRQLGLIRKLVLWNTEQMTRPYGRESALTCLKTLASMAPPSLAVEVWDYSRTNMDVLRPLLPRGLPYSLRVPEPTRDDVAHLRALLQATPKTHDVGFAGAETGRRGVVLAAIRAAGLSLLTMNTTFGEARDAALASCRVLLNLHFDVEHQVFEIVRCGRWMAAGMPLVTEVGFDDPLPSPTVMLAHYSDVVPALQAMLSRLRAPQPAAAAAAANAAADDEQLADIHVAPSLSPPPPPLKPSLSSFPSLSVGTRGEAAYYGGCSVDFSSLADAFERVGAACFFAGGNVPPDELALSVKNWRAGLPATLRPVVFYHNDASGALDLPRDAFLFRASLEAAAPREAVFPVCWYDPRAQPLRLPPAGARPRVSFCGTLASHVDRPRWMRAITASLAVDSAVLLRSHFWNGQVGDRASAAAFEANMASAEFVACPRGVGNFSLRFYEALRNGRVPVVLSDAPLPLPHAVVAWEDVCVRAPSIEALPDAVRAFWRDKCGSGATTTRVLQRCADTYAQHLALRGGGVQAHLVHQYLSD